MRLNSLIATVGQGASGFVYPMSQYSCFGDFMKWYDLAMVQGYGERPWRIPWREEGLTKKAYAPLLPLQLFFSQFISFRIIAPFAYAPTPVFSYI